jgi:hypothetical protein
MVSAEMLNCKLLSKQAAGIKHLYFSLGDGNHHWPAMQQNSEKTLFSGKELLNATKSPQATNLLCEQPDHYEQPNASQQPNILRESTLYCNNLMPTTKLFQGNHFSACCRPNNFQ